METRSGTFVGHQQLSRVYWDYLSSSMRGTAGCWRAVGAVKIRIFFGFTTLKQYGIWNAGDAFLEANLTFSGDSVKVTEFLLRCF